jgi:hypothetical protein
VHEISNVNATTLNGSVPILSLTSTDSGDGFAKREQLADLQSRRRRFGEQPSERDEPDVDGRHGHGSERRVDRRYAVGRRLELLVFEFDHCHMHEHVFSTARAGRDVSADLRQVELGAAPTGSTIVNNAQLISSDAAAPVTARDSVMVIVAQPSSLQLTGPSTVTHGETAVLSGQLTSDGSGVVGRMLSFSLGTGAKLEKCTGRRRATELPRAWSRVCRSPVRQPPPSSG